MVFFLMCRGKRPASYRRHRDAPVAEQAIKPDQWQHVAATYDARAGTMAIYVNGNPVAQAASALSATGRSRHGLFLGQDKVSPTLAEMTLGKAHTLQRYMQACAGRSILPIKFNGSIFTVEPAPLPNAVTHNSNNGLNTKTIPTGGAGATAIGGRMSACHITRCKRRAILR